MVDRGRGEALHGGSGRDSAAVEVELSFLYGEEDGDSDDDDDVGGGLVG